MPRRRPLSSMLERGAVRRGEDFNASSRLPTPRTPAPLAQTRRPSCALRPALCTRSNAKRPSPHCTTGPSSPIDTTPGAPSPASADASSTRSSSPRHVVYATGHGLNARTRRHSSTAGSDQSSRASSRRSCGAYVTNASSCGTAGNDPSYHGSSDSRNQPPAGREMRCSSVPVVSYPGSAPRRARSSVRRPAPSRPPSASRPTPHRRPKSPLRSAKRPGAAAAATRGR